MGVGHQILAASCLATLVYLVILRPMREPVTENKMNAARGRRLKIALWPPQACTCEHILAHEYILGIWEGLLSRCRQGKQPSLISCLAQNT